jgi:hypothetical protein
MVITLIPNVANVRVALVALVLLSSLFLQRQIMPFRTKLANYLELISSGVLLYSFIVGYSLEGVDAAEWPLKSWMQVILWLVNVGVVVAIVTALLWPFIVKLKQKVQQRNCCARKKDKRAPLLKSR